MATFEVVPLSWGVSWWSNTHLSHLIKAIVVARPAGPSLKPSFPVMCDDLKIFNHTIVVINGVRLYYNHLVHKTYTLHLQAYTLLTCPPVSPIHWAAILVAHIREKACLIGSGELVFLAESFAVILPLF